MTSSDGGRGHRHGPPTKRSELSKDERAFLRLMADIRRRTGEAALPALRPMSNRSIYVAGGALLLLGVGTLATLLLIFSNPTDVDARRIDIVRTAGTLIVGGGGAAALALAARRQRWAELKVEIDRRTADNVDRDAFERRTNELFARAIEQLGSEHPAVRIGALHSLSRVGQSDARLRQTVVDVVCSCLRATHRPSPRLMRRADEGRKEDRLAMGDPEPRRPEVDLDALFEPDAKPVSQDEISVRAVAQGILEKHVSTSVRSEPGRYERNPSYWGETIRVDLSDSLLINLETVAWDVSEIVLDRAIVVGHLNLRQCIVTGDISMRSTILMNGLDVFSGSFNECSIVDTSCLDHMQFSGDPETPTNHFAGLRVTRSRLVGLDIMGCRASYVTIEDTSFLENLTVMLCEISDSVRLDSISCAGPVDFSHSRAIEGIDLDNAGPGVELTFSETYVGRSGIFDFPEDERYVLGPEVEGLRRIERRSPL